MGQRCTHASRGVAKKACPLSKQANVQLSIAMRRFSSSASSSWLTTGFFVTCHNPSSSSLVAVRDQGLCRCEPARRPTLTHLTQHNHKGFCMSHCVALCVCSKPLLLCVAVTRAVHLDTHDSCYGGGGVFSSACILSSPRAPLHELIQKRAALVKDLLSAE
jgi:hypothetical protein